MSIAVLSQVFSEARRLAIAGSIVARGDFRLKKLLPSLEQAGQQAPVFTKIAAAAQTLIESPEESSASALLELTSLVNAVLYTQGETGQTGTLESIETTDLGIRTTQTAARELKPLLEALSSTGSGRFELVREAHERGLFHDLRLVRPALAALDDPYPEIAALIADKVLPLYGQAILPELLAKYDLKGTKGHPRRLALMHSLDPIGSREHVRAALENGSKEVKIAAITCLGSDPDDLAFLIEQAGAKAQDVRAATYLSLARMRQTGAVAILQKALAGKDFAIASVAIAQSQNPLLADLVIAEIQAGIHALLKLKDKRQVSILVDRLRHYLHALPGDDHPPVDALLLELFAHRAELTALEGDHFSGADIVEVLIARMAHGPKSLQMKLVNAHAELSPEELGRAFAVACNCLTPAVLYDTFAPYLTAKVNEKKKDKDPAWAQREAICNAFDGNAFSIFWYAGDESIHHKQRTQYDPRWLDLAVSLNRLNLVHTLAIPGHVTALTFAQNAFDDAMKKAKSLEEMRNELALMASLKHPGLTEAFFMAFAKCGKKANACSYWAARLIPHLSREALPRLEDLLAQIPEREAIHWLNAIQKLRTKP